MPLFRISILAKEKVAPGEVQQEEKLIVEKSVVAPDTDPAVIRVAVEAQALLTPLLDTHTLRVLKNNQG